MRPPRTKNQKSKKLRLEKIIIYDIINLVKICD